jgi:hypothetical protein
MFVVAILFLGLATLVFRGDRFLGSCNAEPPALVPPERNKVIAISGDTVIESIQIVREKNSYAAKGADLSNLRLSLWFPHKWKDPTVHQYLVRLTSLEPVSDDTGRELSTKTRLARIDALEDEVIPNRFMSVLGKEGPVLKLVLDAPSGRAEHIKAITGKAEVSPFVTKDIKVDLSEKIPPFIDDPVLKNLKIRPSVVRSDGQTVITLRVPDSHSRLLEWEVGKKEKPLTFVSETGVASSAGEVGLVKTYVEPLTKGCYLRVSIAVPIETRVFEFKFKAIEFPE